jgi:hypothetical protein
MMIGWPPAGSIRENVNCPSRRPRSLGAGSSSSNEKPGSRETAGALVHLSQPPIRSKPLEHSFPRVNSSGEPRSPSLLPGLSDALGPKADLKAVHRLIPERDCQFESGSLQRRVREPWVPLAISRRSRPLQHSARFVQAPEIGQIRSQPLVGVDMARPQADHLPHRLRSRREIVQEELRKPGPERIRLEQRIMRAGAHRPAQEIDRLGMMAAVG